MNHDLPSDSPVESSQLVFDLRENEIVMVIPPGATGNINMTIPGGILIQGKVSGHINCRRGSFILAPGAQFAGVAEADKIYIGGTIPQVAQKESSLVARAYLAISEEAVVHADLASRAWGILSRNVFGSIKTLPALTK